MEYLDDEGNEHSIFEFVMSHAKRIKRQHHNGKFILFQGPDPYQNNCRHFHYKGPKDGEERVENAIYAVLEDIHIINGICQYDRETCYKKVYKEITTPIIKNKNDFFILTVRPEKVENPEWFVEQILRKLKKTDGTQCCAFEQCSDESNNYTGIHCHAIIDISPDQLQSDQFRNLTKKFKVFGYTNIQAYIEDFRKEKLSYLGYYAYPDNYQAYDWKNPDKRARLPIDKEFREYYSIEHIYKEDVFDY